MGQWKGQGGEWKLFASIFISILLRNSVVDAEKSLKLFPENLNNLDKQLVEYVDEIFEANGDTTHIVPGLCIEKKSNQTNTNATSGNCRTSRKVNSVEDYFNERWDVFASNHILSMNLPETARFFTIGQGKSSFLAGFGMGFMALFLKKLLLPVFIVAQIFKSVLIAMFLPSILGSIGKLVGKGLSTVSGVSGSSAGGGGHAHMEDFEFKDNIPYNNDLDNANTMDQDVNADSSFGLNSIDTTPAPQAMNRFGLANHRISYSPNIHSDNYYIRQPQRKTDYKIFHKIPSSSLLLTTYDPFYSPLLSRLDAVFQQLGLGAEKSAETEKCRERLVCLMYANPAKYAPYSNLVSAQLSRELNELRKPSSDNPEILRFFRYMKAAKDGQDGDECLAHGGCPSLKAQSPSPAMLTTFNDINKLVQARKLK